MGRKAPAALSAASPLAVSTRGQFSTARKELFAWGGRSVALRKAVAQGGVTFAREKPASSR